MSLFDHISLLTFYDLGALTFTFTLWLSLSWLIEHPIKNPSVTLIMADYRRAWMQELITREPRIFDAAILSSLREGTSFFASASMIAIGGLLAVIGNTDQISVVAEDLTSQSIPALIWQIKLLIVVIFLTHGFLKFVWANRLFGYCAVIMAAVPNDIEDPNARTVAAKAAEVNIRAAWNFNRGLRAIYFALGSLAWLLGPIALVITTVLVGWLIWNREFSSHARSILLATPDGIITPAASDT
ncbi:MAG: DUF599 domain-containing protein [Pseudomonadota bacterium]